VAVVVDAGVASVVIGVPFAPRRRGRVRVVVVSVCVMTTVMMLMMLLPAG
jgi:hypothetical protein